MTSLPIIRRVVRSIRSLERRPSFFHGHVPVTAMVTLLAAVAAVASGRGGVVMSNEHSASAPNLRRGTLDVNHQWSKSLSAERLIAEAIDERVGGELVVASFLRDRSEIWVAEAFSRTRPIPPRVPQLQSRVRSSARTAVSTRGAANVTNVSSSI